MTDTILKIRNLTKRYGDKPAVDNISLDVSKGEIFGILGPNGAGKTTTLEMIETLRTIDEGQITVAGLDVGSEPNEVKKIIGVQPQSPSFQDKQKLYEIIEMFAAAYGERVNVQEFLDEVQLGDKAGSYAEQLSGGQKQRLSIAAALVHSPKIFFLDEPTTGLDPQARRNLWELVKMVRDRGVTVIITTHYLDEAELLCDRVAIMDNGKIIALDTPHNLIKQLLKRGFKKEVHTEQANLDDVFIEPNRKGLEGLMLFKDILIIGAVIIAVRLLIRLYRKSPRKSRTKTTSKQKKQLTGWRQKMFTVGVFTKLSTKRFFRDRLALFFGILFPLIFLFVFGALTNSNNKVSFSVAIINESKSVYARAVVKSIESQKIYKVDHSISTLSQAENKMNKNQLDSAIVIPSNFGQFKAGQHLPSGQLQVVYTENNQSAGQTLTSVLQANLKGINADFVQTGEPFTVSGDQLNQKSLTAFDYTFAGLLGFTVAGIGIFGPVNVFPELKKQGILRRLHTTPIKVWQYFLATMFSQAITGSVAVAVQFFVAITVFHLTVVGNYLDILVFLVLSIFMILGLGLAIGGWAKNERQAAPLANIIVFPMLFLSGTFFPRYLMPEWLQSVTNYLPLTPVIDGLRMIITEGKTLFQIGPQLGLVALWLVVIYAIAFRVFKWE